MLCTCKIFSSYWWAIFAEVSLPKDLPTSDSLFMLLCLLLRRFSCYLKFANLVLRIVLRPSPHVGSFVMVSPMQDFLLPNPQRGLEVSYSLSGSYCSGWDVGWSPLSYIRVFRQREFLIDIKALGTGSHHYLTIIGTPRSFAMNPLLVSNYIFSA